MDEQRLTEIEARVHAGCAGHPDDRSEYDCCFEDVAFELIAEVRRLTSAYVMLLAIVGTGATDIALQGRAR